jgi:5-methylcytosine-specific restriction protein A
MKKRICNNLGCNTLINDNERYCSEHIKEKSVPFANSIRYNESLYNTAQWRTLRKIHLQSNPSCIKCGATKKDNIKIEVHHLVPPRGNEELFFDENNLATVCSACHRILTNQEIGKRLRKRK